MLSLITWGKVLLHTCMQQLLHNGLCGSKKKATCVQGSCADGPLDTSLSFCCFIIFYAAIAAYKYVAKPFPKKKFISSPYSFAC